MEIVKQNVINYCFFIFYFFFFLLSITFERHLGLGFHTL